LRDIAAIALFAAISIVYFARAICLATHTPLWMDEILAIWTARQPNVGSVWSALVHGSEFCPPLYDVLLHGLIRMGASSRLAFRLPSIIAVYVAALAAAVMVRRYSSWTMAALAASVILCSGIFSYAVQARPYACVTATFAWACVTWHALPTEGPAYRRSITLSVLLTLSMALHFYAILLVGTIALNECVQAAIERRAPRLAVMIAVTIAAASILLWWPIAHSASVSSQIDSSAPLYYGRPTADRLALTYHELVGWLAIPVLMLLLLVLIGRKSPVAAPTLGMSALILSLIPAGVFVFALLVSHSYATRYTLAGTLGLALIMPWLAAQLKKASEIVALLLLMVLFVVGPGLDGGEIAQHNRLDTLAVAHAAPGNLPIATGNGLRFFELRENSPPEIARRIVFLDLPHIVSADPTNRHQVERWKAIQPNLPVVDAQAFTCATPSFLALYDPQGGIDDLPQWLVGRGLIQPPQGNRPSLKLVTPMPCAHR
jgi:hypothetical protein